MEKQLELDWETATRLANDPCTEPDLTQITEKVPVSPPSPGLLDREPACSDKLAATINHPCSSESSALHPESLQRIRFLEQALDQCQIYINELKGQLAEQEFLEAQLAATEDASNIQQQAIAALKTQLARQQLLEVQIAEALEQKQALVAALDKTEVQVQQQQFQLEQLQLQARQEQLSIAQLQQDLSDRQTLIQHLEARLERAQQAIASQQEMITALQESQPGDSNKNKVIQGLSKNLLQAQNKIEAMEAEFSNQLILQAQVQHSCQELETRCLQYQERVRQLEHQTAEMQEQILHQAQQASEYEAAVQHWKDRCLSAEQSVTQLKSVLEQLLIDRNLIEFAAIPGGELPGAEPGNGHHSGPHGVIKGLKLDLPAFLRRHPRPSPKNKDSVSGSP